MNTFFVYSDIAFSEWLQKIHMYFNFKIMKNIDFFSHFQTLCIRKLPDDGMEHVNLENEHGRIN